MFPRLFAVLLLGALVAMAQPAAAVTPLTITSLECESLGGGRGLCVAEVTGGTGGNTYTWTRRQLGTTVTSTSTTTGGTYMHGCSVGYSYSITLVVRDSAGTTASATSGYYCTRVSP